jgi:hypothetical protein
LYDINEKLVGYSTQAESVRETGSRDPANNTTIQYSRRNTTTENEDEKQTNKCTHAPGKSDREMKEGGQGVGRMEYVAEAPEPLPTLPFPDVETTKRNWSAHCSYPTYIPEHVQKVRLNSLCAVYLFVVVKPRNNLIICPGGKSKIKHYKRSRKLLNQKVS